MFDTRGNLTDPIRENGTTRQKVTLRQIWEKMVKNVIELMDIGVYSFGHFGFHVYRFK